MLGSTRSGGLWLSRKVRMLMITFSPISTRPSIVAEPICGSSATLPCLGSPHQLRMDRGPVLVDVESGPADLAGLDQLDQRVLVDHLAARGVDDVGLFPGQLQSPRRAQVESRRRVRTR